MRNVILFAKSGEVRKASDLVDRLNSSHSMLGDPLHKEASARIQELQLALWEINKRLNDSDSWLSQSIDCRDIAEYVLGESKDGN